MKKEVAPLTTALAKKELLKSFETAVIHHFKAGDIVIKERQISDSCFYLTQGRVQISKQINRNSQVKLGILGAGQFFGEMAMLSGSRRSATVIALNNVEVIEIGRSEFERLTKTNNSISGTIALHFSVQMANRLNRLLKLLEKRNPTKIARETATDQIDVRQVLHKVYSFWAV